MTTANVRFPADSHPERDAAPGPCPRSFAYVALALLSVFAAPAYADEGLVPPRAAATWLMGDESERRPNIELAARPSEAPLELGAATGSIVFDRKSVLAQASEPLRPGGGVGLKPAERVETWGSNKSYLIPAAEIVVFDTLLNIFDRLYFGGDDFDVTFSTIRRNIERGFANDADSFTVNQLGHPYQGSMYHGFARASGLNFWEGFLYAFAGSAFWEIAGETTRPSSNDQIHTSVGGSLLGEALFRMANLWLEQGPKSRFWREVGAAVISPPVGFNRLAFDNRFKGVYPSNNPEYYSRLAIGVSEATQNHPGTSRKVDRTEGILDFALDYGLPGRPGYVYRRPFDYFTFQAIASTGIGFESVMTRGLLFGTDYGRGPSSYRGIWGLYGSYDYIAPQIFRLASSALSLGTTLEWRPSKAVAIQGTLAAGVGYASVSTIHDAANERSNSYGVAPQAALGLRFIVGERAALDLSAREFFVSSVSGSHGHDNVVRADAALTWRLQGRHAVAVKYQYSRRDAEFADLGDRRQSRGTLGIFYTWLGRDRFGTGDWK